MAPGNNQQWQAAGFPRQQGSQAEVPQTFRQHSTMRATVPLNKAYSNAIHVQAKAVGEVSQGQRPASTHRRDVHVGEQLILAGHHLQQESRSIAQK